MINREEIERAVLEGSQEEYVEAVYRVGQIIHKKIRHRTENRDEALQQLAETLYRRGHAVRDKFFEGGDLTVYEQVYKYAYWELFRVANDLDNKTLESLIEDTPQLFYAIHHRYNPQPHEILTTEERQRAIYKSLAKSVETFRFRNKWHVLFYQKLLEYWIENRREPWSREDQMNSESRFFSKSRLPVEIRNAALYHLRKSLGSVA